MAKICVFFFMSNHSGLATMAKMVKKPSVTTTFQRSGESSVKVCNYSWLNKEVCNGKITVGIAIARANFNMCLEAETLI